MRAVEFKSRIRENKILIPRKMRYEMLAGIDKRIRVAVFLDDADVYEEKAYRQMTKTQFLKGYAESDSIYDYKSTIIHNSKRQKSNKHQIHKSTII